LLDDVALACSIARQAGAELLRLRAEVGFDDPRALRDSGDRQSQTVIAGQLALERPADAVLSEEAPDNARRLAADRVWIIDPLDGTREFAEEGRTDWAVHVALWVRGALVAGAVALPGRNLVLSSEEPPTRSPYARGRVPRIAVSRTRPPSITAELARALGAELVPMGSAGAKVAAVVLGDVDAYVHGGGQYEWDSAAPVAVALAAGLHATRLDGSPLCYNQPDPLLPDLLVCVPELAADILAVTARQQTLPQPATGGGL
jgi:3'(2'), 5'-bisphosphate nucleotidase